MSTSVIGLFETYRTAQRVVTALVEAGCEENDIEILDTETVAEELVNRGYRKDRAQRYAEAVQHGGALVAADTQDDQADRAVAIMDRHHVMTPDEVLESTQHRRQGGSEEQRAQVVEEELQVGKRQTTGGKRLTTKVTERPVEEQVALHEERVEAERQRSDRKLSPAEADDAFEETTIEMTGISEQAVASKEARVVEEVTLGKQVGERRETVRRSDVKVEDVPPTL
jgi:hypothetical protein